MPRYLLDTDICSYIIKRKSPDLLSKLRTGLLNEALAISAITRGELLYGIALLPEATSLHLAVRAFLAHIPCLEWPVEAAEHYATQRATQKITGNLVGHMDTLIACHALAENLILVTNNQRNFGRFAGLRMENWMESVR